MMQHDVIQVLSNKEIRLLYLKCFVMVINGRACKQRTRRHRASLFIISHKEADCLQK